MSIKYHDNTVNPQYGEDHTLVSNWSPDSDYGNEYVKVYFRVHTKGYDYPDFSFAKEDKAAFNAELAKVFTALGWECKKNAHNGSCATWHNGYSHLYLHPQEFTGEVLKNDVKTIAEALENNTTFRLQWVDLYETVYDMTDEEYEKILSKMDEEIRKAALQQCKTKRKTQFYYMDGIVRILSNKFRLARINEDDGRRSEIGQTGKHITNIINSLIAEGYLIVTKNNIGCTLVRTINKTEQKQRKLIIA